MNSEELETKTQAVFVAMTALANEYDTNRPRQPWYDHRYDWLRGPDNWTRLERIVYGGRYVTDKSDVLDLCCGDGLVSHCIAQRARRVNGLDVDPDALIHAELHYGALAASLDFFYRNIITDTFPLDSYDVVLWFDGLAYLTQADGRVVLNKVADCLPSGGVLIGSTPLASLGSIGYPLSGDRHRIFAAEELRRFLALCFRDIEIWESNWGNGRTQLYFICKCKKE
uniref:Putative methyltransferase n=1 Tax=viral metagenome TaxID=1070528 RepID=A0A6M3KGQ8_9ZZZZ